MTRSAAERALHTKRTMHVDDNVMTAFLAGELPAPEQSHIRGHLDDCPECRDVILHAVQQAPRRIDAQAETLALGSDVPVRASGRRILADGTLVGPYMIEQLIGVGGMGVVYAARDSRLDRVVALKLLRNLPGFERAQVEERMRRESKALARLSHPNVTVVYELGGADDELFVAMEYVAGETLRTWQVTPRAPREIIATYVQAGRGLAAAHAAGLVHRDFKPDNVLIGTDGTVKVTDFGLARIAGDMTTSDVLPTSLELTAAGSVLGTPAYMAPEQFDATTVDARADQFAFCVALFEALYGARPFRGTTLEELRTAVRAGRVVVPRDRNVPTRVRQAVLRGLAVAPEARFPSMDALLAELAPRRTSVVLGLGGFTIVAAAAMAMIALTPDEGAAVCQGAPGEVARVWNAQRRDNVQRAFAASGARDASGTFAVVERGLDAYFARWVTMHGEACEATHKFKQQSQAALDLRTACLGRKRAEVDALVEVLAQADAGVVQHVRQAIASLPSLDDCIDVQRAPEPADPALVAKLDRARALVDVARYSEAIALLDPMATASAPAKFPVLAADVEHVRAKALAMLGKYVEAEEALFRGLAHAQGARADAQIAVISVDLANVIGYRGQRTADGLRWIELARAAISAKGGDELLGARLETVHASILSRAGKRAEAEAANRAALAIVQRRAPNTALEAEVHGALGISLAARGKFVEAAVELERSLVLTEQHYGTQHALTANGHANLANALRSSGRVDEALAHYRTALEVNEAVFGKDGVQVATVLSNLGQTMQERGALRDAREYLERALAIRERALGADDPQVARTAANLGYLLLDEKSYEAALAMFTRVGQILEKRIGTDNPARSDDLAGVGLAYLGLGKSVEAIAPLTRAAELGGDGDPLNLASIHAALARALYTSGRDRARATTLARTARAALADAGEQAAVADIDRWLR